MNIPFQDLLMYYFIITSSVIDYAFKVKAIAGGVIVSLHTDSKLGPSGYNCG